MIRKLSFVILAALATNASASIAAPIAYYNPATGFIVVNQVSLFDLGLGIKSPNGLLVSKDEYQVPNQIGDGGTVSYDLLDLPTAINFGAARFPNPFIAGYVVKPGTPISELAFTYYSYTGTFPPHADTLPGVLVEVPEPSSLLLASLGALGLIRRRQ